MKPLQKHPLAAIVAAIAVAGAGSVLWKAWLRSACRAATAAPTVKYRPALQRFGVRLAGHTGRLEAPSTSWTSAPRCPARCWPCISSPASMCARANCCSSSIPLLRGPGAPGAGQRGGRRGTATPRRPRAARARRLLEIGLDRAPGIRCARQRGARGGRIAPGRAASLAQARLQLDLHAGAGTDRGPHLARGRSPRATWWARAAIAVPLTRHRLRRQALRPPSTSTSRATCGSSRALAARGAQPTVAVGLASDDGFPHAAAIEALDNQMDTRSGTVRVRARIDRVSPDMTPGPAGAHPAAGRPALRGRDGSTMRLVGTDQDRKYVPGRRCAEQGRAPLRRARHAARRDRRAAQRRRARRQGDRGRRVPRAAGHRRVGRGRRAIGRSFRPSVVVHAQYPGANARTIAETVAAPLEQFHHGVEDMLYMDSKASGDGHLYLNGDLSSSAADSGPGPAAGADARVAGPAAAAGGRAAPWASRPSRNSPIITIAVHMVSPNGTYDNNYISKLRHPSIVRGPTLGPHRGRGRTLGGVGPRGLASAYWLGPAGAGRTRARREAQRWRPASPGRQMTVQAGGRHPSAVRPRRPTPLPAQRSTPTGRLKSARRSSRASSSSPMPTGAIHAPGRRGARGTGSAEDYGIRVHLLATGARRRRWPCAKRRARTRCRSSREGAPAAMKEL
eukprot:jgi/Botrbrau1/20416/Bobra.0006s0071.1